LTSNFLFFYFSIIPPVNPADMAVRPALADKRDPAIGIIHGTRVSIKGKNILGKQNTSEVGWICLIKDR
jgi:hypothetical protein